MCGGPGTRSWLAKGQDPRRPEPAAPARTAAPRSRPSFAATTSPTSWPPRSLRGPRNTHPRCGPARAGRRRCQPRRDTPRLRPARVRRATPVASSTVSLTILVSGWANSSSRLAAARVRSSMVSSVRDAADRPERLVARNPSRISGSPPRAGYHPPSPVAALAPIGRTDAFLMETPSSNRALRRTPAHLLGNAVSRRSRSGSNRAV